MIKIIDTYPQIDSLFASKQFNFEGWKLYINSLYNQSAQIFIDDLKECLNSGSYVYERDVLLGEGRGRTKKDAEKNAAKQALDRVKIKVMER